MTHTDLAQKLKVLPGLTDDERADLLTLLNRDANPQEKTYGLVWENKPEQVEEDLRNKLPVLHEIPERRIVAKAATGLAQPDTAESKLTGTVGSSPSLSAATNQLTIDLPDSTGLKSGADRIAGETGANLLIAPDFNPGNAQTPPHHLLIEGDNLHALTVLNYTHVGKVDVIYIDPPYNTGNKDFKYNDRFVDREDSYRHSKWLSFMHKRLELARTLLKPEGVIFISIDDNEQAQLKLLCDRVFGEVNMQAEFVWKTDGNFDNQAKIKICHEYVYCFCKDISRFKVSSVIDPTIAENSKLFKEEIQNTIVKNGPKNPVSRVTLPVGFPALFELGTVRARTNKFPYYHSDALISDFLLTNEVDIESGWASRSLLELFINTDFQPVIDTKGQETVFKISDTGSIEVIKVRRNQSHIISVLSGLGNTQSTSIFLAGMGIKFSYPKPVNLVKYLLELGGSKNAIILDFFAGSGTTLHAVMALNAEDGGNRQCILVTNNENNIAEEVCYERNRRVIEGYTNSKSVAVPGLTNNHLHYYQTAYVGRERTLPNKRELMRLATELLCLKEGCYVEQKQTAENVRLFTNDTQDNHVVVVYDEDAITDAVAVIQNITPTQALVKVYVFAPGFYPYTDDFEEVANRIDLVALPEAIYQAYARLLPPMGTPVPVVDDEPTTTLPTADLSLLPVIA